MNTNYSFAIGLFDASRNPSELLLWQAGTLTLDTASPAALTGELAVPGFYSLPIPFSGSQSGSTMAGTTIDVTGESRQAQITATLTYNFDGFLYSGSYIAGLVNLFDPGAEETYLYVLQGLSPQGPFGAHFRSGTDKRVPQPG